MNNKHAQTWLNLHCQMISSVHCAVLILSSSVDERVVPAAVWPTKHNNVETLLQMGRQALKNKKPVLQNSPLNHEQIKACLCAYPLIHHKQLIGTLVIQVKNPNQEKLQAIQHLLNLGSAWLQISPNNQETTTIAAQLATVLEITAKSLERETLQDSATSVVTHLAQTFSCDRVSFGHLVDTNRINVTAVSHSARIDRRSEVIQHIESAMEESLDEAQSLTYPSTLSTKTAQLSPLQKQLCLKHKNGAVCSLLLNNNGKASGALTFERHNGLPFDQATVEVLETIAAMIGPVFEMKRLQDRPTAAKVSDTIEDTISRLIGGEYLKAKLTSLAILSLCLFVSIVTGTHRISAEAILEGTEHRALVAAIDGFVDEAHLRAGQQVLKGDLIATLDTSRLKMKHRQVSSELENLSKKHDRAIGDFDRAEATILQAQLGRSSAQLSLIEEQIARTRIIAPIDGVIVSGDLSHILGGPVERGQVLFEIAPLDGYRMALHVHESDIAHIKPGQNGFLALSAAPGERLGFVVEDIIGVALTDDNKNGFRVEARLESNNTQLRPGMHGVGKIEASERSLLWIWGHTLFDRLSLWLWSNLP